jgi:Helix-turn-helix domain
MPAQPPISDDDRRRVRALHSEGLGRNQIAKAIGRSAATVTKIAGQLGLTFDRASTVVAVEAKRRTAAERRAGLALALLGDAERLRAQLWQPHMAYAFGGRDNDYAEHEIAQPAPVDKAHLMRAASIAVDKSLRLDEYDRDGGADRARSMLGQLFGALTVRHESADAGDA